MVNLLVPTYCNTPLQVYNHISTYVIAWDTFSFLTDLNDGGGKHTVVNARIRHILVKIEVGDEAASKYSVVSSLTYVCNVASGAPLYRDQLVDP